MEPKELIGKTYNEAYQLLGVAEAMKTLDNDIVAIKPHATIFDSTYSAKEQDLDERLGEEVIQDEDEANSVFLVANALKPEDYVSESAGAGVSTPIVGEAKPRKKSKFSKGLAYLLVGALAAVPAIAAEKASAYDWKDGTHVCAEVTGEKYIEGPNPNSTADDSYILDLQEKLGDAWKATFYDWGIKNMSLKDMDKLIEIGSYVGFDIKKNNAAFDYVGENLEVLTKDAYNACCDNMQKMADRDNSICYGMGGFAALLFLIAIAQLVSNRINRY